MEQGADDMFFDHADGYAEMRSDLQMAVSLQLVHHEGLPAGRRQSIEVDGKLGQFALHFHARGAVIGKMGLVEAVELHTALPLTILAVGKIDRRMAGRRKEIAFRMVDRLVRPSCNDFQVGILNDFLAAVAIADKPCGEPDRLAMIELEQLIEQCVAVDRHSFPAVHSVDAAREVPAQAQLRMS